MEEMAEAPGPVSAPRFVPDFNTVADAIEIVLKSSASRPRASPVLSFDLSLQLSLYRRAVTATAKAQATHEPAGPPQRGARNRLRAGGLGRARGLRLPAAGRRPAGDPGDGGPHARQCACEPRLHGP